MAEPTRRTTRTRPGPCNKHSFEIFNLGSDFEADQALCGSPTRASPWPGGRRPSPPPYARASGVCVPRGGRIVPSLSGRTSFLSVPALPSRAYAIERLVTLFSELNQQAGRLDGGPARIAERPESPPPARWTAGGA